jgi:acyl dehydratase
MSDVTRVVGMAVNPDFVGRSYPPSGPYAVDAALIAAFAASVGSSHPVHTDPEAARSAGYADVVAPPTMAVRFSQAAERAYVTDPEAGIDFSRVVHGEQRFVHHRPITAGDEVVGTTTVDAVRSAGGHAMITTRTELATTAGEALATSTSTIVVRGGEE